jgi:hypothetical protein
MQIERELPKMAGTQLDAVSMEPSQRVAVRRAIDEAWVSAFRRVLIGAAVLALAAAALGARLPSAIRNVNGVPRGARTASR